MPRRTPYEVLGLPPRATASQIKKAFRALARQTHPDHSTDPDAPARFMAIQEAYQTLLRQRKASARLADKPLRLDMRHIRVMPRAHPVWEAHFASPKRPTPPRPAPPPPPVPPTPRTPEAPAVPTLRHRSRRP